MRIVTFNTQHARRSAVWAATGTLADYCAELEADVLALQEIDAGTPRSAWKDQAAAVADAAGMEHVFGRARRVVPLGHHGVALLVRGTVEEARVVPLAHWRRHRGRCAVLAVVTAGGRRVSVAATHLSPHRGENVGQLPPWSPSCRPYRPRLLLGDLNLLATEVEPVLAGTGLKRPTRRAPACRPTGHGSGSTTLPSTGCGSGGWRCCPDHRSATAAPCSSRPVEDRWPTSSDAARPAGRRRARVPARQGPCAGSGRVGRRLFLSFLYHDRRFAPAAAGRLVDTYLDALERLVCD